jgi:hypothetical protein
VTTTLLQRIAIGVIVLVALWVGGRLLPRGTDRLAGRTAFRLPSVAPDSADSIVVAGPHDTIVATRHPGGWTVNGERGSREAIAELFTALGDSAPAELVAQSAASFGRLGLDSAAARRVRVVVGGRSAADVLVSERGPDYQGAYVRLPGDSAVYAVRGRLGLLARRTLDDWRDKTVATVTPDSVRQVELERGARRTLLRRRDSVWTLAGGAAADTAAVRRLLERWRTVTAAGFPTPAQRDSAFRRGGRIDRRATLRGTAGVLAQVELDSTAGGWWARRAGDATVYRLNTWDVDELVPGDSVVREKAERRERGERE